MIKLCDNHMQDLIVEIWVRGLISRVPDTSDDAQQRWAEIRAKGVTKETFEPVHFAAMAIILNANSAGGVVTSEPGTHCPICADTIHRAGWIKAAATDAHSEAKRLGLDIKELLPEDDDPDPLAIVKLN